MRIVFLLTQDLESPSGLGRYWPLGRELRRLGHNVSILALHSNYAALTSRERDFVREGVHIRYVGQMHVRKVGNHKLYFNLLRLLYVVLRGTLGLTLAALRTSTDAYHVGKPHPMNGLAGLVASRLRRKPLYLDCDDYEAASNRFGGQGQRMAVRCFEEYLPHLSRGVTTNTQFMFKRLSNSGVSAERIRYVPNGVERSRILEIDEDAVEELRRELGIGDKRVILYLGSMSLTNHAVDLLMEAFASVKEADVQALLLLVGGGEDYDALRRQAESLGLGDAVRFVGHVHSEQAPLYYRLADVSVDPVRDDPANRARCPLKIAESLASGTPVVSGDVGDRSTLLAFGGGLLASSDDPDELAEALLRILRDGALRNRLEKESLTAREHFYWQRLAVDFAEVYNPET